MESISGNSYALVIIGCYCLERSEINNLYETRGCFILLINIYILLPKTASVPIINTGSCFIKKYKMKHSRTRTGATLLQHSRGNTPSFRLVKHFWKTRLFIIVFPTCSMDETRSNGTRLQVY